MSFKFQVTGYGLRVTGFKNFKIKYPLINDHYNQSPTISILSRIQHPVSAFYPPIFFTLYPSFVSMSIMRATKSP